MNNQDARPFVDLKKDAEEFRETFDDDIQECINYLDSGITALICDPDSLGYPERKLKQNALVEFSKAKYDVFLGVKSLINKKENEWINYISEMKKLFIENVEIFLAGTKLEVKLPSSEFESSPGPRKSPGNRKSDSSFTSSIYPIMNKITKSIPVGGNVQSNSNSRLSVKLNKSSGNVSATYHEDTVDSSEDSENEARPVRNRFQSRVGRSSATATKLISRREQSEDDSEMDTEPEIKLNTSKSVSISNGMPRRNTKRNSSEWNTYLSSSRRRSNSKTEINNDKSPELKLNSTQPEEDAEASIAEIVNSSLNSKKPSGRSKKSARFQKRSSSSEETSDVKKMEPDVSQRKNRRGRQSTKKNNTHSTEKETTENTNTVIEEESSEVIMNVKTRRGRAATSKNADNSISGEETLNVKTRRGRAATSKNSDNSISVKKAAPRIPSVGTRVRRRVAEVMTEVQEEDEITSIARPTKSAARRKTMLPNFEDPTGSDIIPANPTRAKSKRKTICGVAEMESAAPSKRLKVASKRGKTPAQVEDNEADDNLLESDDDYSEWIPLKSIDGKIPTGPAIYEVKVWRAKKPAYIGSCDSLRQKLTLYKLKQNSGHKHLDKFVDRNYDDIQIRYETVASSDNAKQDVKNRIKSFVEQYKTTPAYN